MLQNYFKVAIRNILRNKVFSLINIIGLAAGLAISIIILVYVKHELSYDRFHNNADQIYLLGINQYRNDVKKSSGMTAPPMGPDITREIPAIEQFARISSNQPASFEVGDKQFTTGRLLFTDSAFLDIFSFKILRGNQRDLLNAPDKVVLTTSFAQKIFNNKDPLGELITLNGNKQLLVTGIVQDPPLNTHLDFDALVSFDAVKDNGGIYDAWDGNFSFYTYVKTIQNTNGRELTQKAQAIFDVRLNKKLEPMGWRIEPVFEKLTDLHLRSELNYLMNTGSLSNVYIYLVVAVFILIIAGINFMNLTSSLAFKRFKEVGLRRVVGATRTKVVYQFLGEAVFISFLAMIIALIFIEMYTPTFNRLFNTELKLYSTSNIYVLLAIPLLAFAIGVLSGMYPAMHTSKFKPVNILKGEAIKKPGKLSILNILVILQFVISIGLIISTSVIGYQVSYLLEKDLGFNTDNLIVVRIPNNGVANKSELIRDEFLKNPHVINASVASDYPARGLTKNGYVPEGFEKPMMFHALYVDFNYLGTLNLEIVKGRGFDPEFKSDKDKYLVNEALVKQLGWDKPVGKWIERNGRHQVIGVVKDFHFNSLHKEIAPLIFTMSPRQNVILVHLKEQNKQETIQALSERYKELSGENTFNHFYLSDTLEYNYRADVNFGELINSFTVLAIIIACLGLFGLTAFSSEQRTKEIAVRKVLGASVLKINGMVIGNFLKLVLIAAVISWPVTFYFIHNWLQNYAYKIELNIWYFLVPSLLALIIAVMTLSYHSIRAANTNPAKVLKYE